MKARFGRHLGIGRYSEILWNENRFTLGEVDYERDKWNGRCYLWSTPTGFYTRAAREGGLVRYRIPAKRFAELQKECETRIAAHEAWETGITASRGKGEAA
jgi:hypothetical protein